MKTTFSVYSLEYKYRFGVSNNTRTHTNSVFIKLSWEGFEGYGEACLPPYLGETVEQTIDFFNKAIPILNPVSYPCSIAELIMELDELDDNCNAAKAAIDIALHDLKGKIENKSVQALYRIRPEQNAITSCTIGIDKEEIIAQKIKEAADFSILKIKAGTQNDKALINLIRTHTDKPLYIDVNQGWTDKQFAVDMIGWCKEKGAILIEQPLPKERIEDMVWVTKNSVLPTIADENVKRLKDILPIKDAFSGINIKLMKCTGIKEAFEMIELAKELNLKVFLGCMAESSCGTSAMAQLMSCADYVDLDAPNLLKNDPFTGVTYANGQIHVSTLPGIGVTINKNLISL